MTFREMEEIMIVKTMEQFNNNKTKTAQSLGITIKTLYNKLHEYGLFDKYQVSNLRDKPLVPASPNGAQSGET